MSSFSDQAIEQALTFGQDWWDKQVNSRVEIYRGAEILGTLASDPTLHFSNHLCWRWLGAYSVGQPVVSVKVGTRYRTPKVHRLLYANAFGAGKLPEGGRVKGSDTRVLARTCQSSVCINPDHLAVGPMREVVMRRNAIRQSKDTRPWVSGRRDHMEEMNTYRDAEYLQAVDRMNNE